MSLASVHGVNWWGALTLTPLSGRRSPSPSSSRCHGVPRLRHAARASSCPLPKAAPREPGPVGATRDRHFFHYGAKCRARPDNDGQNQARTGQKRADFDRAGTRYDRAGERRYVRPGRGGNLTGQRRVRTSGRDVYDRAETMTATGRTCTNAGRDVCEQPCDACREPLPACAWRRWAVINQPSATPHALPRLTRASRRVDRVQRHPYRARLHQLSLAPTMSDHGQPGPRRAL